MGPKWISILLRYSEHYSIALYNFVGFPQEGNTPVPVPAKRSLALK